MVSGRERPRPRDPCQRGSPARKRPNSSTTASAAASTIPSAAAEGAASDQRQGRVDRCRPEHRGEQRGRGMTQSSAPIPARPPRGRSWSRRAATRPRPGREHRPAASPGSAAQPCAADEPIPSSGPAPRRLSQRAPGPRGRTEDRPTATESAPAPSAEATAEPGGASTGPPPERARPVARRTAREAEGGDHERGPEARRGPRAGRARRRGRRCRAFAAPGWTRGQAGADPRSPQAAPVRGPVPPPRPRGIHRARRRSGVGPDRPPGSASIVSPRPSGRSGGTCATEHFAADPAGGLRRRAPGDRVFPGQHS